MLPLIPDRQHRHDLLALNLVQSDITAGTKRNDDLAEGGVGGRAGK